MQTDLGSRTAAAHFRAHVVISYGARNIEKRVLRCVNHRTCCCQDHHGKGPRTVAAWVRAPNTSRRSSFVESHRTGTSGSGTVGRGKKGGSARKTGSRAAALFRSDTHVTSDTRWVGLEGQGNETNGRSVVFHGCDVADNSTFANEVFMPVTHKLRWQCEHHHRLLSLLALRSRTHLVSMVPNLPWSSNGGCSISQTSREKSFLDSDTCCSSGNFEMLGIHVCRFRLSMIWAASLLMIGQMRCSEDVMLGGNRSCPRVSCQSRLVFG